MAEVRGSGSKSRMCTWESRARRALKPGLDRAAEDVLTRFQPVAASGWIGIANPSGDFVRRRVAPPRSVISGSLDARGEVLREGHALGAAGATRRAPRRTPPFHARGSAGRPGSAGWRAPR